MSSLDKRVDKLENMMSQLIQTVHEISKDVKEIKNINKN